MIKCLFFCGIGLLLPNVTTELLASEQHTIAKRKSAKKIPRKKGRSKQRVASISPFVLRLLYSPSYRFLTEEQQDRIDEADEGDVTLKVSRIFPIATGIEGEFAFNNLLSLAVGGSFSYQGDIMTWEINDRKINQSEVEMEVDYYEFTVNSSMYANVNRVKLGPGLGLTFANVTMDASLIDDNKKWELSSKFSYKRLSAHFSLRRDFFSTQSIGVGVGLTASMYLTDMFSRRVEQKSCEDGNDCETKTEDDDDFDDDESQGFYSVMLIPMIYLAS